jgi:hypothetical protein
MDDTERIIRQIVDLGSELRSELRREIAASADVLRQEIAASADQLRREMGALGSNLRQEMATGFARVDARLDSLGEDVSGLRRDLGSARRTAFGEIAALEVRVAALEKKIG